MLNWLLTEKVDHPLASAKESRRVIDDLPKEAHKALAEIAFWLGSVNDTDGFRVDRRFELIDELDRAARLPLRKLGQDYLPLRQEKLQEHRLWIALARHWSLAGAGYVRCIEAFQADEPGSAAIRSRLPLVVGRALHALSQHYKWLLLRYGLIEGSLWGDLGRLYAFAEAKGFCDQAVALHSGAHAGSSARQEFLRTVMLAVASPQSLLPAQIEIAERTVAFFAGRFAMEQGGPGGGTHAFDLAMRNPPGRASAGSSTDASVRRFGAGPAYQEISRVLGVLSVEGALPSEVNLGSERDPKAVIEVWRHLLRYWSLEPPARGSERHPVNVRLTVVPGFVPLAAALEAAPAADPLDFSAASALQPCESWVAQDESDAGYGALVPATHSDWVRIGALLGARAQGSKRWRVGIVRRLAREGEQGRRAGIELVSRAANPVRLSPVGTILASNATPDDDPAILLTPRPDAKRQIRILMRPGGYTAAQTLSIQVRGQTYLVQPASLLEASDEFDLAVFDLLERVA